MNSYRSAQNSKIHIEDCHSPGFLFVRLLRTIFEAFLTSWGVILGFCIPFAVFLFCSLLRIRFQSAECMLFFMSAGLLYPFIVAVEEYSHCAVLIRLGHAQAIQSLEIVCLHSASGRRWFPLRISVSFKKEFPDLESLFILLAGPLCATLLLSMITFFMIIFHVPIPFLSAWCVVMIGPLFSLIPIQQPMQTDGYHIRILSRRLNLSRIDYFRCGAYSVGLVLSCIFQWPVGSLSSKSNPSIMKYSAWKLVQENRYSKAVDILEEAYSRNPEDPELCNNLACCYFKLNINRTWARELARMAVQMDGGNRNFLDTYDQVKDF